MFQDPRRAEYQPQRNESGTDSFCESFSPGEVSIILAKSRHDLNCTLDPTQFSLGAKLNIFHLNIDSLLTIIHHSLKEGG